MFAVVSAVKFGLACLGLLMSTPAVAAPITVAPRFETTPTKAQGDAIDDPAVWVHPTDPAKSLIVGTDKKSGYSLYTLSGELVFSDHRVAFNNIDVRYGYTMPDGRKLDLIVGSDKHNRAFHVFGFSDQHERPETLMEPVPVDSKVYGVCLYHSAVSGDFYVFTTGKDGKVVQHRLLNADGKITAQKQRTVQLESTVEGCVADDEYGELFVGEEEVGIWSLDAEPTAQTPPNLVDQIAGSDHLAAEIEGLAIYATREGQGYLMASVQSRDEFAVFERQKPHRYLFSFKVGAGVDPLTGLAIDAVSHTDGIEIISTRLGDLFPYGAFIAQDDQDLAADGRSRQSQNFKLVPVEAIAKAAPIPFVLDHEWDPRAAKKSRHTGS